MQESASGGYVPQQLAVPPRPPSQPVAPLPSVRPALVAPGHFTLLPPSAQYVCQPPVPLPAPYRLVGAHGQELPISGLTYQLMAPQPQPHPVSAAAVQLIPAAAPIAEIYPSSQHPTYLQPESTAAEAEPVVQLSVDPKSGATMYGPVDPSYQVIQPPVGDASLSYAMPSGEISLSQPSQQHIQHPPSSLPPAAVSSRQYEDAPEYYPSQSTLLVTSLHPTGSRPALTGSLRQPVSVIISSICTSIFR